MWSDQSSGKRGIVLRRQMAADPMINRVIQRNPLHKFIGRGTGPAMWSDQSSGKRGVVLQRQAAADPMINRVMNHKVTAALEMQPQEAGYPQEM